MVYRRSGIDNCPVTAKDGIIRICRSLARGIRILRRKIILSVIKFFPAEQAGGLAFIKAMAAPYTSLSFMPTGGINPENVKKYLEYDRIFACGGSWMVKGKLIAEGRFDEIEKLTREAAEIVKNIRG